MCDNTRISFSSSEVKDELSALLQTGARKLIATAVEGELAELF